jgi:hypothetical protein
MTSNRYACTIASGQHSKGIHSRVSSNVGQLSGLSSLELLQAESVVEGSAESLLKASGSNVRGVCNIFAT